MQLPACMDYLKNCSAFYNILFSKGLFLNLLYSMLNILKVKYISQKKIYAENMRKY